MYSKDTITLNRVKISQVKNRTQLFTNTTSANHKSDYIDIFYVTRRLEQLELLE